MAEVSLLIPSTLDCLTWLVNRIQVVKPKSWSMLGLPNPSYQNCLLLIPAQFVTMSRASLKGKDFILCIVFMPIIYNLVSALRMYTRNMQSGCIELAKEFKKMAHKVAKKPYPSTLWVMVLVSRPLCMQSAYGVRRYSLFI